MAAPMMRHATFVVLAKCRFLPCRQLSTSVKCYNFVGRRPVNVYSQGEADKMHNRRKRSKPPQNRHVDQRTDATNETGFQMENEQLDFNRDIAPSIPPHIKYQTLRDDDKKLGAVVHGTKTRKSREKKKQVLLEGMPLIREALSAGVQLQYLFFVGGKHLEGLPMDDVVDAGTELFKVKMRQMELWSEHANPPGIMGVCQMPPAGQCVYQRDDAHCLPVTLICDGIRDQGFLGTIIRTAAGVGCHKVILTKGCVDVWDPKVLRTATGSHFRVPLLPNISWDLLGNYIQHDSNVYLADCRSIDTIDAEQPERISRRDKSLIAKQTQDIEEIISDGDTQLKLDDSFTNTELLSAYSRVPLPAADYTSVDYQEEGRSAVVVLSGEVGEPSPQARKLVYDRHGQQVFVPLVFGVDRLNPALAASLVLFEARKQFMERYSH